jgi:hypothetical protein
MPNNNLSTTGEIEKWYTFYSETEGRDYYYNPRTRKATWISPNDLLPQIQGLTLKSVTTIKSSTTERDIGLCTKGETAASLRTAVKKYRIAWLVGIAGLVVFLQIRKGDTEKTRTPHAVRIMEETSASVYIKHVEKMSNYVSAEADQESSEQEAFLILTDAVCFKVVDMMHRIEKSMNSVIGEELSSEVIRNARLNVQVRSDGLATTIEQGEEIVRRVKLAKQLEEERSATDNCRNPLMSLIWKKYRRNKGGRKRQLERRSS